MFQELDTPPSRCCWRCGCAIVSLITADIDQAFEACSSSAVLPAWRRISQSYESRFSSNSFLVSRGRRELCKPGSSQSFGRGWLSFTTLVLAPTLFGEGLDGCFTKLGGKILNPRLAVGGWDWGAMSEVVFHRRPRGGGFGGSGKGYKGGVAGRWTCASFLALHCFGDQAQLLPMCKGRVLGRGGSFQGGAGGSG